MNKLNKILVATGLAGLSLTSCKRDVDLFPAPTNTISDLTAYDTRDRVEGNVRSIYASIKNSGMYGGRYQIFNDIRGGDFNNERTNVVTGFDVWQYTPTNNSTNSVQNHWSQAYYVINLANVFLDGMSKKGTAVVGQTLSNNFIAEARFLRAMSYYSLLQFYCRPFADGNGSKPGVPLRLTPNTGSGNYALARATVAQVYAQILEDLNFAETNVPLSYANATLNTTRAHRNTVIAFKTRVYLSMGQWNNVITEANKIVSTSAPFAAASGVAHTMQANVRTPYTNFTTTESILSMPFAANEQPGTQNQLGFYYGPAALNGGSGEYSLIGTGIIADANWKATDARRGFIQTSGGKSWLMKYTIPSTFIDWAPVIRYPEVMLNLAEALAETATGVDARAVALLNAVRQRSDATTTFAPTTKAELISLILNERRIELLGEGFAGADLTRRLQPLPAKASVASVPTTSQQYIWPIPANELLLNPLMTDN
jgi:hypothetical protein